MAAYLIAEVRITDPERYKDYQAVTPGTIEKYGGRFVVRGGNPQPVEGNWQPERVVVVEFDDMETAKAWYNSPEYQAVVGVRHEASEGRVIMVEGA